MNEQKDIKRKRMRLKKEIEEFFLFKREIAVQKKPSSRRREIKKIKGQTEKEMKKEVNAKRDEQKQEVTKKGRKKNL